MPDARAMAWGFKSGHPLFKAGLWCYTCCPGCGPCTCASLAAGACPACPDACTPQAVEAVLAGIVPACFTTSPIFGSKDLDANGATLTGTYSLANDGPPSTQCVWTFRESPGSTFNFREFTTGGGTCTGSSSQHRAWGINVAVRQVGGVTLVKAQIFVSVSSAGDQVFFFNGEVAMPCPCAGTVVVHNGDGGQTCPGQTGAGSITVTFCPA